MSDTQRPPIWVGHVDIRTAQLDATEAFFKTVGLRPCFRGDEVAVLEFRGGTHVVVIKDDSAEPTDATFDLMVEDLDKTYAEFKDFHLFRMRPLRAHLIAGFGRIHWIGANELLETD